MVQDGSEAVDRRVVPLRVLEALRHRDAEGARMVRLAFEQRAPDVRRGTRRRVDRGAVELHEVPPLGLPIVHRADPVDRRLEVDQTRGIGEGRAPLSRAGLRRHALVPFALRIPRLCEGRVDLVAARRTVEFRLVVEVRGSPESFLEARGPDQRPRPCRSATRTLPAGITRTTSSIGTVKTAARRFAISSRSSFPGRRSTYRLDLAATAETGPPMILRWPSISTSPIASRTGRS